MGDCMKSCKRMAANTHYTSASFSSSSCYSSSKRSRIVDSVSPEVGFLPLHHLNRRRNSVSSGADSRSSRNESLDIVEDRFKPVDLELEARSETDVSTCINGNKFSRENTPSSELRADPLSEEMDTPAKRSSHRRKERAAGKVQSQAEIEEFFTAAEKYDYKRFAEKYNFDIVKDAPLEGRYQWVRLKQ